MYEDNVCTRSWRNLYCLYKACICTIMHTHNLHATIHSRRSGRRRRMEYLRSEVGGTGAVSSFDSILVP